MSHSPLNPTLKLALTPVRRTLDSGIEMEMDFVIYAIFLLILHVAVLFLKKFHDLYSQIKEEGFPQHIAIIENKIGQPIPFKPMVLLSESSGVVTFLQQFKKNLDFCIS
jgi:hypothetical protein